MNVVKRESVMGKISFEKISSTFTILNPFNDFAPEEHRVEVRKDPLLGDTSVHNPYLKDKARAFFGDNDEELIKKLAEESAKDCIFCGENVLNKTARYPPGILSHGRLGQERQFCLRTFFPLEHITRSSRSAASTF